VIRVAGLDLSLTKSGMALPDETFATITLPARLHGYERHPHVWNAVLGRLKVDGYPDVVVIEGYANHSPGSIALIRAAEIGGYIRAKLTRAGVPVVDVAPAVLKKYATGKGNAAKEAVYEAALAAVTGGRSRKRAQLLGTPERVPAGFDEADAYWLRRMAIEHYGRSADPPERPKLLDKIVWPELEVAA
jgi:crossover junction endodeoxyribonuclease RuvC